jgi:hypothetical protein
VSVDINELAAVSQNLLELHTQLLAHPVENGIDSAEFDNLSNENISRLVTDKANFHLAGELLNDEQLSNLISQLDNKTLVEYADHIVNFSTILTLIDQDKMKKFIKSFDAEDFIFKLDGCDFNDIAEFSTAEKITLLADKVFATLKILLKIKDTSKYEVLLHSIGHYISEDAKQDYQKLQERNYVSKSTIRFVQDFKDKLIAQRGHVSDKFPKIEPREFKGYTDKMKNIRKKELLLDGLINDIDKFLSAPAKEKFHELVLNFSKRSEEASKIEHYGIFNKATNNPSGTQKLLATFVTEAGKLKTTVVKHESSASRKSR